MGSIERVRVGIGGWTYAPWRDNFFPKGLAQSKELEYASRQLSSIEINGTFRNSFKPAVFAKWRDTVPDDFVFAVKASQYATHRRELADAGETIDRFIHGGLAELGAKLGPIVWQFPRTRRFILEEFEAFLALLPEMVDTLPLRHVLDVRHESFMTPDFVALARRYRAAIAFADTDEHPSFADLTSDFVYARLMRSHSEVATGYPARELDAWAQRARLWQEGGEPSDLPRVEASAPRGKPRDVFVYFISGAKERAPAAALALVERLNADR